MTRDMADAHETARARDARASTVTYEVHMFTEGNADFDHVINCPALHTLRTRTHFIDPDTGEFTPLTQETDMDNRKNMTDQCQADPRTHSEKALDLIADRLRDVVLELRVGPVPDTLAEIRDRLPERTEVKVAPFDPDLIARNLEAFKHELEAPMREHGECCEPDDETCGDLNPVIGNRPCRLPRGHAPSHDDGAGRRWWPSTDPSITACRVCGAERPLDAECSVCKPAPADDLPGEPVEPGDLRAGDRVAFTFKQERMACTLVSSPLGTILRSDTPRLTGFAPNVVYRSLDEWCPGISDVRLIERAPREDEGEVQRLEASVAAWKSEVVKSAHRQAAAMADRDEWKARATKAEAERDEALARCERVSQWADSMEAERDALRERLDALRVDVENARRNPETFTRLLMRIADVLDRDDERVAKGEQR